VVGQLVNPPLPSGMISRGKPGNGSDPFAALAVSHESEQLHQPHVGVSPEEMVNALDLLFGGENREIELTRDVWYPLDAPHQLRRAAQVGGFVVPKPFMTHPPELFFE